MKHSFTREDSIKYKITRAEFSNYPSVRKTLNTLKRKGYPTNELEHAMEKRKRTRDPESKTKEYFKITIKWMEDWIFGDYQDPVIVEPKPKEIRIPISTKMGMMRKNPMYLN